MATEDAGAANAAAIAAANADATPDPHLIGMTKDGETIHVNPVCVAEHVALGWRVAEG